MSHDLHFLERLSRLDDAGTDLALSLYARADLVGEVIARAAPPGTGRVAIALGEGERPPCIVAERDGRFVTCLAAGMAHDLPVVARADVALVAQGHARRRQAAAVADSLREDEDQVRRASRVYEGPRLSREEARELNGWGLLLDHQFFRMWASALERHEIARQRYVHAERLRARHLGVADMAWRRAWMVGHLAGPCSETLRRVYGVNEPAEPRFNRTLLPTAGMHTGLAGSALRCVHAAAGLAEAVIGHLEEALGNSEDASRTWGSALTMVAIGLRSPALRPRVEAALREPPAQNEPHDAESLETFDLLQQALHDPEKALRRHLDRAIRWLEARIGDVSRLDERVVLAAPFYDSEQVVDVEQHRRLIDMVPFVAASEWADLYLPRSVLDRLPRDDEGDARRYADAGRVGPEPAAPRPPKAGRNDPCPCGSGKKSKRCCGA